MQTDWTLNYHAKAQKNESRHVAPNVAPAENGVPHGIIRKSPEMPMNAALWGFYIRDNLTNQQSGFIIL